MKACENKGRFDAINFSISFASTTALVWSYREEPVVSRSVKIVNARQIILRVRLALRISMQLCAPLLAYLYLAER